MKLLGFGMMDRNNKVGGHSENGLMMETFSRLKKF